MKLVETNSGCRVLWFLEALSSLSFKQQGRTIEYNYEVKQTNILPTFYHELLS